jgi:predicted nucleic acid-binding Zn ribbon protein
VDIMPWYEYLCESGHETAVQQKITAEPLTECLKPGVDQDGKEVQCCSPCKRQLCKSSFSLKGGGWSGDGYAKSGKG